MALKGKTATPKPPFAFVPACAAVLAALGLALATLAPEPPAWASGNGGEPATGESKPQKINLPKAFKGKLPITELTEDEAAEHALNRLAFGPRPGDLERVKQMGLEKWIDQQLDPASMDTAALDERLAELKTLRMSSAQLLERYPFPQMAAKQRGLTLEQYQQKRQQQVQAKIAQLRQSGQFDPARAQEIRIDGTPQQIIAELSEAKLVRAIYDPRQLDERLADFWFNHFNVFARKGADLWFLDAYERDTIRPHAMGKFEDLLTATAKSPAMLFYLDNWLSVDPVAFARNRNEIVARRQQAVLFGACGAVFSPFGRPNPIQMARCQQQISRQRQQQMNAAANKQQQDRGLNENYGRELMELHTVGVHYTQTDVTQMAQIFTGWTIQQPRRDPEFNFEGRLHTPGAKTVLGYTIKAGGMKDGQEILHKLAGDPRTARFLSRELARHFVMDEPPQPLVDHMAKAYLKSHGDIRQVMRAMIYSPEFWSRQAYRAKVKTPFELVVSAIRATGADVDIALPLAQWVGRMGQPLYLCETPNGYPDTAQNWIATGALLDRMNFAIAVATNHMPGAKVDLGQILTPDAARDPQTALNQAFQALLDNQVTPATRDVLGKRLADPQILQARLDDPVGHINEGLIVGLVLGSPEFQRH
ncbi:MAG TPA: DUF1800 domain-containing protein [Candidatus Acidoferrales bacterium]|nr:DUF1800 domain-containing protein [Candidatus Acidoferrales bacterium]